jgi:hypothetical protein
MWPHQFRLLAAAPRTKSGKKSYVGLNVAAPIEG